MASPFAASEQQQPSRVTFAPGTQEKEGTAGNYALVASPSGKNLFVETPEFDVLAPHRPRDKESNKGEGLGFLFSCFSCCGAPATDPVEPAATAERHYSLPPSESLGNLAKKED